jgi:hypothetical protein
LTDKEAEFQRSDGTEPTSHDLKKAALMPLCPAYDSLFFLNVHTEKTGGNSREK